MDKKEKENYLRICEKVIKNKKPEETINLNEFLKRVNQEKLDEEMYKLYNNVD